MSLAELEKQVQALSKEERLEFVSWIYAHEDELVEPTNCEEIAPDVMQELLRRRDELAAGNVRTFTVAEASARVGEALDEIQRSRH